MWFVALLLYVFVYPSMFIICGLAIIAGGVVLCEKGTKSSFFNSFILCLGLSLLIAVELLVTFKLLQFGM